MNVGSRYFESFLCCRVKSMTAKVSGIIHSSKVSGSNNFFKVGRSTMPFGKLLVRQDIKIFFSIAPDTIWVRNYMAMGSTLTTWSPTTLD